MERGNLTNHHRCSSSTIIYNLPQKRELVPNDEYDLGISSTKRCKTHHTTTIHDLPRDILCDILSRLPAESLIGYKLVSKFWKTLISHKKFVDAHLTRSFHQWEYQQVLSIKLTKRHEDELKSKREYELMNFTQHKCQFSKFEFEYELLKLEQEKAIYFQSSCNGLLLFSRLLDAKELYVINPVTRKYRVLPVLKVDQGSNITDCALIYDASAQKYKVIAISDSMQTCYVHTLDKSEQITNAVHWKKLVTPYKESSILSLPMIVNNELHWLASVDDSDEFIVMYTMDISKEEFKETKISFLKPGDWGKNTIVEFIGSLSITDYPKNLKQLDIWSLQDREKGEWAKRSIPYEFDFSWPKSPISTSIYQTRVLIYHKSQIFIYDLKNKEWKTVNVLGHGHANVYFVHSNSLVKWG